MTFEEVLTALHEGACSDYDANTSGEFNKAVNLLEEWIVENYVHRSQLRTQLYIGLRKGK
jgi:hypothetical protein